MLRVLLQMGLIQSGKFIKGLALMPLRSMRGRMQIQNW